MNTLLLLLSFASLGTDAFLPQPVIASITAIPQDPLFLAVAITGVKTGGADFLAQKLANRKLTGKKKKGLDKRRMGLFSLYGGVYLGLWQHTLFSHIYTKLFPMASVFAAKSLKDKMTDSVGAVSVLKQVASEAFLHWPWLYIPAFYVLKEVTAPGGFKFSNLANILRQNWVDDLILCWKVWVPVAIVNFSFFPIQWQVPFTALVSFCYMAYFSMKRGGAH